MCWNIIKQIYFDMRTQEEILQKIESLKDDDFFGFKTSDLIEYLNFENAKPFLKDGVTPEQWHQAIGQREYILKVMLDYMPFAWDKANYCRGLSAMRSLEHFSIWVWLLGDESKFGDLLEYEHYGKEHLIAICDNYGWDWKQWDNGKRVNSEDK